MMSRTILFSAGRRKSALGQWGSSSKSLRDHNQPYEGRYHAECNFRRWALCGNPAPQWLEQPKRGKCGAGSGAWYLYTAPGKRWPSILCTVHRRSGRESRSNHLVINLRGHTCHTHVAIGAGAWRSRTRIRCRTVRDKTKIAHIFHFFVHGVPKRVERKHLHPPFCLLACATAVTSSRPRLECRNFCGRFSHAFVFSLIYVRSYGVFLRTILRFCICQSHTTSFCFQPPGVSFPAQCAVRFEPSWLKALGIPKLMMHSNSTL